MGKRGKLLTSDLAWVSETRCSQDAPGVGLRDPLHPDRSEEKPTARRPPEHEGGCEPARQRGMRAPLLRLAHSSSPRSGPPRRPRRGREERLRGGRSSARREGATSSKAPAREEPTMGEPARGRAARAEEAERREASAKKLGGTRRELGCILTASSRYPYPPNGVPPAQALARSTPRSLPGEVGCGAQVGGRREQLPKWGATA